MRTWIFLAAPLVVAFLPTAAVAQQPPAAVDAYTWSGECRDCHAAVYDAWAKTKHARAFDRLSGSEKQRGECVGCHVSGPKEPVKVDGRVVNANVQCEGCHGPGQAHVAAAKAGNPAAARMTKKPGERVCVECHNEKSPKFRGFLYDALTGLVHRTK